jgi:hypothetical protein
MQVTFSGDPEAARLDGIDVFFVLVERPDLEILVLRQMRRKQAAYRPTPHYAYFHDALVLINAASYAPIP